MASRFRFPAADAGTETEDEERRRGVEGVAGGHEARARLEGVHQAPQLSTYKITTPMGTGSFVRQTPSPTLSQFSLIH